MYKITIKVCTNKLYTILTYYLFVSGESIRIGGINKTRATA
jgi:hypothetical protein